MKRIRDYEAAAAEVNYYTFSSAVQSPDEALNTLTLETGGTYIGIDDFANEYAEETVAYLAAHWDEAEEMADADAGKRVETLADAWGLVPADLDYLK